MKYIKKTLETCAAGFALAVLLVMAPVEVQAAELTMTTEEEATTTETVATTITETTTELSLRSIFSAKYYAEKNPDVVAILGDDEEVLYDHFKKFGISEGRDVSPIIDLKEYRRANPDLIERYGNDWAGILSQFVTEGIYQMAEGTRPSVGVRFNPVTYLNAHPEIGDLDLLKVVEVFISEGMPAGIWADPVITGGEGIDAGIKVMDTMLFKNDVVFADNNLMASAPVVSEPTVEYTPDISDSVIDDVPDQTEDNNTDDPVKQPEPIEPDPVEPDPVKPVCNHLEVFCGNTCNVCNQVIGHYFGESGTDPYCTKCNADFVQVQGCPHSEWSGGTCKLCWKVDNYYTFHDGMHVGETCPDCGYKGTVKYEADKCPGHDYGNGDTCVLCGEAKSKEELSDEVLNNDAEVVVSSLDASAVVSEDSIVDVVADEEVVDEVVTEGEIVADDNVAVDEETTGDAVVDIEETVEATDAETEEKPEADAENAGEGDALVADELVADSVGASTDGAEYVENVEVGDAEVAEATDATDGAADAEGVELDAAAEAA